MRRNSHSNSSLMLFMVNSRNGQVGIVGIIFRLELINWNGRDSSPVVVELQFTGPSVLLVTSSCQSTQTAYIALDRLTQYMSERILATGNFQSTKMGYFGNRGFTA